MDKPRGKQAYLNYNQIQSYIDQNLLDSYDEVFAKDRGIKYYIDDNHNIVEIKSTNDVFNSELEALTKLNSLGSDYYVGQIISIKSDEEYIGYIVNYNTTTKQYSIAKICDRMIDYNKLENIPIINIVANDPIVLSDLDDGYYSIVGSYQISPDDTTHRIATSKVSFIIEHDVDKDNNAITYITEQKSKRIKHYIAKEGELIEDGYVLASDLEQEIIDVIDDNVDKNISEYVDNNQATSDDISNLFS